MPVCEELDRIFVRRRGDRLAGADRVGQRAGDDLLASRIWGDEQVGGLQPAPELGRRHEAVDEPDMVAYAELTRARHQALPIGLTLASHELGVPEERQSGCVPRGQCRACARWHDGRCSSTQLAARARLARRCRGGARGSIGLEGGIDLFRGLIGERSLEDFAPERR